MYRYSNKFIVVMFVLALVVFLPFNQASAQVNFETDEPTFDANNPSLNVQDFQAASVPTNTIFGCTPPINSSSNDSCFSPGDILPGIEFVDNPGPEDGDLIVLGDSLGGSTSPANVLANNSFPDTVDINFTGLTDVVGLTIGCASQGPNCIGTMVVNVFGAMDNLLGSTNVPVTEAVDAFIGIESVDPISRINLDFLLPNDNVRVKGIHEVKFSFTPIVKIVDVNQGACALTKSSPNGFKIEGATPNSNVAVVMGLHYGSLTVNGPVCNGLELGIEQIRIFALGKADELGNLMFQSPVPPIGQQVNFAFFQVVDIATCTAGEVNMFDIFIDEIPTNDNDGDGVPNCMDACPDEGLPGEGQGLGEDGCITDEIIIIE